MDERIDPSISSPTQGEQSSQTTQGGQPSISSPTQSEQSSQTTQRGQPRRGWGWGFGVKLPTTNPNSTHSVKNGNVFILPPDIPLPNPMPDVISKQLYREFKRLEKQIDEFFGIRKSFLNDCATIVNTLKDNILMVYGIVGGMGMLASMSCKDAFKGSIMMMVMMWIGVMFSGVAAWMNLRLKMEESSHWEFKELKFKSEIISWAKRVASGVNNPNERRNLTHRTMVRVSYVLRGPMPLSLGEHYARICKLCLMSIATSFLIPLASYILHCKEDEILGWLMWLGTWVSSCAFGSCPTTHPIPSQWPT